MSGEIAPDLIWATNSSIGMSLSPAPTTRAPSSKSLPACLHCSTVLSGATIRQRLGFLGSRVPGINGWSASHCSRASPTRSSGTFSPGWSPCLIGRAIAILHAAIADTVLPVPMKCASKQRKSLSNNF